MRTHEEIKERLEEVVELKKALHREYYRAQSGDAFDIVESIDILEDISIVEAEMAALKYALGINDKRFRSRLVTVNG